MLGTGLEVYVNGNHEYARGSGIIHELFLAKGNVLWVTIDMGNGRYISTDAARLEVIE